MVATSGPLTLSKFPFPSPPPSGCRSWPYSIVEECITVVRTPFLNFMLIATSNARTKALVPFNDSRLQSVSRVGHSTCIATDFLSLLPMMKLSIPSFYFPSSNVFVPALKLYPEHRHNAPISPQAFALCASLRALCVALSLEPHSLD